MSDDERSGERHRGTDLTHVTPEGDAQMVDVGGKTATHRRAVATGEIRLQPETIDAIRQDTGGKGDVLATARIGAIQAVKHTWEAIPLCHPIPITNVETTADVRDEVVELTVVVETVGKTGCEMEAIQGVTTGLSVIWDMVKALEKDADGEYPTTEIAAIRIDAKHVDR